ncbi:hypothetical protein H8N00_10630 [Streptomyces sp. AC563]|uniref:hypothetical protein n=1 Tax=Streptomyces buecherae TaxID=2763006 RepID=UPI00164DB586|nr:hypothetical protein [Streptomyces buecherae]MBC3989327.1 hypothetical protein [Streptomyces buecherae]
MARPAPPSRRRVLRAEDFYQPPPDQPADAWALIPPAERVVAWYERQAQRRLPRPPDGVDLGGPALYAQINHGRWVALCDQCNSAQLVSPADPRLYCVECLTPAWRRVRFPKDPAAAEAAVGDLPTAERNWWHPHDEAAWNRPAEPPREGDPR